MQKRKVLPQLIQNELTERQREALKEFYVNQLCSEAVGAKLGITPASARRLRHRAEAKLARFLRYLD